MNLHTVLLNRQSQQTEQDFENNNFVVKGINGYRPIVQRDAYRKPVLIDPITLQVAPSEILSSDYSFVSPSGRYRVDYKRLFKNKHTNQVVSEVECAEWMKEYSLDRLSYDDKEAREIVAERRRSYVEIHPEYFEKYIHTLHNLCQHDNENPQQKSMLLLS